MEKNNLIGVIHLPPLAGSAGADGLHPMQTVHDAGMLAIKEAKLLEKAGFTSLIVENFGDTPFYKEKVNPETIAALSLIIAAVKESVKIPIGVNVLRNDARSALGLAAVTGAEFIRVNVLTGVYATDQGLIEGDAATLIRERNRLNPEIKIFADVHVKHARSLSSQSLGLAIEETALRAQADAVIVTGETTGRAIDLESLEEAYHASRHCGVPLYVGSGVDSQNIQEIKKYASGVIISSALRKNGRAGQPLDLARIQKFMTLAKKTTKVKASKKKGQRESK